MTGVAALIRLVGSLLPYVMPQYEFKPKRLFAVIIIFIAVTFTFKMFGEDGTESIIDLTEDVVEMTEESIERTGE